VIIAGNNSLLAALAARIVSTTDVALVVSTIVCPAVEKPTTAFEPAGTESKRARSVSEPSSIADTTGLMTETVAKKVVLIRPAEGVAIVTEVISVLSISDAEADGATTTERPPKPKAATVTSAMRLKVVFVDICFLSISQDQEFPVLGFELIS
jgi:hypothetical protein